MHLRPIFAIISTVLLIGFGSGCATQRVTMNYVDLQYQPPVSGHQPVIEGSINGISGQFVIDTGAMGPTLTPTAVQRCGLATAPSNGLGIGVGGGKVNLMQATNITVTFSADLAIHWKRVMVLPSDLYLPQGTNGNFFGMLDYQTLRNLHAVMDMRHKTITLSK